ncbi:MAG: hypothetical protein QOH50_4686 [Kribbellaceae bacterium]|jgi:hypothetical protein|nr:hypothetical protein [Kribbellaceae bacterium]
MAAALDQMTRQGTPLRIGQLAGGVGRWLQSTIRLGARC